MREYEVTVIVQPQLEDEARNELIERVEGWLTHGDSEADKPVANHWGQRRLAYPIRDHNDGYYVMFDAKLEPSSVAEIERNLQFTEDLLRYLIIRKEL